LKDLTIHVRYTDADSLFPQAKMKGKVQGPLLNVLAVINEVELFPLIFANNAIAMNLKVLDQRESEFWKLVQQTLQFPWPLKKRQLLLSAKGYDLLDEDVIIVVAKSVSKESLSEFGDQIDQDCEELSTSLSGAVLRPISPECTEVEIFLNLDKGATKGMMGFWLSFFFRLLAEQILTSGFLSFEWQCRENQEMYNQIMKEKEDLYLNWKERVDEYFEQLNLKKQQESIHEEKH
jgi:hypothetical protein